MGDESSLLAQLAAKDAELMKLKEELLALKANQQSQPQPLQEQQEVEQQPPAEPPQRARKKILSHIPYECITTKPPDGRDSWPNVSRMTPPEEFATQFADMVKVGCYCWRVVDKIDPTSRGDRKHERVLAITAEFLFICDLQANIHRVLRCRDVERILVQETETGALIAIKTYTQCEEHSILLDLRPDPRNPNNKLLHPIFALNYTRKPKTKTDVELIRVAPTTDLRKHAAAGQYVKPQGYLAPHLKMQKWRETGKWPCGSSTILPTARSVPGARKLAQVTQQGRRCCFTDSEGKEVVATPSPSGVKVTVNGEKVVSAASQVDLLEGGELRFAHSSSSTVTTFIIADPEPGPAFDALLRDLAAAAAKSRALTSGLPLPVRRPKVQLERRASLDSLDGFGKQQMVQQQQQPRQQQVVIPPPLQSPQREQEQPPQQQEPVEIQFVDTDGDTNILRLVAGKIQWCANGTVVVPQCGVIKYHDEVLTGGRAQAKVAEPKGEVRKEMLKRLAEMVVATKGEVKAAGLPLVTGVLPPSSNEVATYHDPYLQSDASSVASSCYSHNPYAIDEDDASTGGVPQNYSRASPVSSICSSNGIPGTTPRSTSSQDPYYKYPYQMPPSPVSVHSEATDLSSRPTLLSSIADMSQTHSQLMGASPASLPQGYPGNVSPVVTAEPSQSSQPPQVPPPVLYPQPQSIHQQPFQEQQQQQPIQQQQQQQPVQQQQQQPIQHQPTQIITTHPTVVQFDPMQQQPVQPIFQHFQQNHAVYQPPQPQSSLQVCQEDLQLEPAPTCIRVAVMFKHGRRGEYASRYKVKPGQHVVVRHPDGLDVALVMGARQGGRENDKWKVLRLASSEDVRLWQELVQEENEALKMMQDYVEQSKMPITLHRAEYQIDKKKLTFHFSSEQTHPNFGSLVHFAHARFGCRIWMNNCFPKTGERGELIDLSADTCPTF